MASDAKHPTRLLKNKNMRILRSNVCTRQLSHKVLRAA